MAIKNKTLVTSSLLLSITAVACCLIANNSFHAKADGQDYVIECNSSKNLLTESSSSTSGTGTAKTKLGNDKSFSFESLSHSDGSWQTIEEEGYFVNTTKIDGIFSFDINFANDNAKIAVQIGWNSIEPSSEFTLFATNKRIEYVFDYVEGKYPSLIKIIAKDSALTISSMNIRFACEQSEVMTMTEFNKLFSGEITDDEITISDYSYNLPKDVVIPAKVYGDKMYTVTAIGVEAFKFCELNSIYIPGTVVYIDDSAFAYAPYIKSVTFNSGLEAIRENAFLDCSYLESFVIPDTVTYIDPTAFHLCTGLTNISVAKGNTVFDSRDNCGCIIDTSENKLLIGSANSTIPNSITSIEKEAFMGCKIKSITIPDSVTTIGQDAFFCCGQLKSLFIPASVTSIGATAFSGCNNLTSIDVAKGNTVYDSRDNCNAIIKTSTNNLLFGCGNTVIPNTITSISNCSFFGCYLLTTITIPDGITSIGVQAFYDCSSLSSDIVLPSSLTTIRSSAFSGCSSLKNMYIPDSVWTIESRTFYKCQELTIKTQFENKPAGWNMEQWQIKDLIFDVEP